MRQPEVWKTVPGYPDYEVSDLGRLRTFRYPKYLRVRGRGQSYRRVWLCRDGGRSRSELMHRLVLLAFVGPPPPGHEACHNDGNRRNNTLENLRWDTRKENAHDRMRHGTMPHGEGHPMARVSRLEAMQVKTLLNSGWLAEDIANQFSVPLCTVKCIRSGKHWSERTPPLHASEAVKTEPRP